MWMARQVERKLWKKERKYFSEQVETSREALLVVKAPPAGPYSAPC